MHRLTKTPPTPALCPSDYFVHPMGLVDDGAVVGRGTKVWAFAHVLAGAVIGEDCNLCDQTFVEGNVRIGNRVTLKNGVYLWSGVTLENDVFVGPGVAFTNDLRPRSKHYPPAFPATLIKTGCSIGANATILPGLTLGRWAMIGAGAVVTRDVPDHALAVGSPARFVSWICRCGLKLPQTDAQMKCECGRVYLISGKCAVTELPSQL